MYYEEKVIDGVLCFRDMPNGKWRQFTLAELTIKLQDMEHWRGAALRLREEKEELAQRLRDRA